MSIFMMLSALLVIWIVLGRFLDPWINGRWNIEDNVYDAGSLVISAGILFLLYAKQPVLYGWVTLVCSIIVAVSILGGLACAHHYGKNIWVSLWKEGFSSWKR